MLYLGIVLETDARELSTKWSAASPLIHLRLSAFAADVW